jgi:hypothetical protein
MNSVQGNIVVKEEQAIRKENIPLGKIPVFDQDGKLVDSKVRVNPYEYMGVHDGVQQYWSPLFSSMVTIGNSSSFASNLITYIPFVLERDIVLTELAVSLTNGGNAGSKMNIGIVKSKDNHAPLIGKVMYQSPEIAIDVVNDKIMSGLSVNLSAGLYYFAMQHNSKSTIKFRGIATTQMSPLLYIPALNSTGWIHSAVLSKTYQSTFVDDEPLPVSFSASTGFAVPVFYFKSIHR